MDPWRAGNPPIWQSIVNSHDPNSMQRNEFWKRSVDDFMNHPSKTHLRCDITGPNIYTGQNTPPPYVMTKYTNPPFAVEARLMPAAALNTQFSNRTFNCNSPGMHSCVQEASAQQEYPNPFFFTNANNYPSYSWVAAPHAGGQLIPRPTGQLLHAGNNMPTAQHNTPSGNLQKIATRQYQANHQSRTPPISQWNMKGRSYHASTSMHQSTPSNAQGQRRYQRMERQIPVKLKEDKVKMHTKNDSKKPINQHEELYVNMAGLKMKDDEMTMQPGSHSKPNEQELLAKKNLYTEHPDITRLLMQEVEDIRMSQNIHIEDLVIPSFHCLDTVVKPPEPQPIPKPIITFEQGFFRNPEILKEINRQGFGKPTPIQCQLWPVLLSGHDAVGIAQTGSGKTLAFLLPALLHIRAQNRQLHRNKPTVLILAPTRELAIQIKEEADKIQCYQYRSVCLIGGIPKHMQLNTIRSGVEIVVATPGRLNDLVQSGDISLEDVSFLVLDEADEMLDQGFEPQINKALLKVRRDRQTVLTSATWPPDVRRMAKNYTTRPFLIHIGELELQTVSTVHQRVEVMKREDKEEWFLKFIRNNPNAKVMVFCASKPLVDHLSSEVASLGIHCESIHSGLSQEDRESSISYMKSGQSRILIASDVASRGIDIPDVTHVINYDFPRHIERYVHRVGRTGRAGNQGEAITLLSYNEKYEASLLIGVLEKSGQEIPKKLRDLAARRCESWGRQGKGYKAPRF
ncbi:hypothetical protein B566_EDAN003820 [Ephemera danica]|nr:hypothetical protein B566_EDAN003820 [Ephemera danica]